MATQLANCNASAQSSKAAKVQLISFLHSKNTASSQISFGGLDTNNVNIPPIAPQDRNGTSMRIMMHDTQAMFEKYAARADNLVKEVGEVKRAMLASQKLSEDVHENTVSQMVDLGELQ